MEWWGWLASILAGVVLVANAIKAVRDIISPALALEKRVEELEKHDKKDMERFENIEIKFAQHEATNQAILKGLVALINHELDGNSVEGLKNTRDALLTHIIEN